MGVGGRRLVGGEGTVGGWGERQLGWRNGSLRRKQGTQPRHELKHPGLPAPRGQTRHTRSLPVLCGRSCPTCADKPDARARRRDVWPVCGDRSDAQRRCTIRTGPCCRQPAPAGIRWPLEWSRLARVAAAPWDDALPQWAWAWSDRPHRMAQSAGSQRCRGRIRPDPWPYSRCVPFNRRWPASPNPHPFSPAPTRPNSPPSFTQTAPPQLPSIFTCTRRPLISDERMA